MPLEPNTVLLSLILTSAPEAMRLGLGHSVGRLLHLKGRRWQTLKNPKVKKPKVKKPKVEKSLGLKNP
jgi:hypothetical protein